MEDFALLVDEYAIERPTDLSLMADTFLDIVWGVSCRSLITIAKVPVSIQRQGRRRSPERQRQGRCS